jgi:hypothetical protein
VNAVLDAEPAVKIEQICTTAQQYVLAIIDRGRFVFGVIQRVRSGAAAQMRTSFENGNRMPFGAERDGGGETRETAPDHDDTHFAASAA